MTNEPNARQIRIDIDEPTARGTYANFAFIIHSETEFLIDFTFLQPQAYTTSKEHDLPRGAKVLARIIHSPVHAKRLLWALKDNIEKYEARFGAIKAGDMPEPDVLPTGLYQ